MPEETPQQSLSVADLQKLIYDTITPVLKQYQTDLVKDFETKYAKPAEAPKGKPQDELTLQVEALKAELDSQRKASRNDKISKSVLELAAKNNVVSAPTFEKLLRAEYGESLQEIEGEFYVKKGDAPAKRLDSVVTEYLESPEGAIFRKPSGVNGSGTKETRTGGKPDAKLDSGEALMQAFSNFNGI